MGNKAPAPSACCDPANYAFSQPFSGWHELLDSIAVVNDALRVLRVEVTAAIYLDRSKVRDLHVVPIPTQKLSQVMAEVQWSGLVPVSLRKPPLYIVLKFKGSSAVELMQTGLASPGQQIVSCGMERCAVLLKPPQFLALLQLVRNITSTLAAGTQMRLESTDSRAMPELEPRDSECSICLDERVGVALPCGHGFCQSCIEHWAARSFRGSLTCRDSDDITLLSCPTCRDSLCADEDFLRSNSLYSRDHREGYCTGDASIDQQMIEAEAAHQADRELWHFETWDQSNLADFIEEARERFFVLSRMALEDNFEAAGVATKRMCVITRAPVFGRSLYKANAEKKMRYASDVPRAAAVGIAESKV